MPVIETKGAASSGAYGQFARQVAANYIEDVFSTYLYAGAVGPQYIDNSIQLETTLNAIVYQRSFVQVVANTTVATQAGDVLVMFSRVPFASATLTINSASISPVDSLVDSLSYTSSVFISTLSTSSTNIVTNSPGLGIHNILIIRGASNVSLANALSESGSSSTTTGSISSSGFGLFWGNDRDPYQNITGGSVTVTSGYNQYFSSKVMSYNGNGTTIPATTFSGFGAAYSHTYAVVKVEGLTATPSFTQGFGGMVWIKNRTSSASHRLLDTTRSPFQYLASEITDPQTNFTPFQQFSRGFSIAGLDGTVSSSAGDNYASWTFRKQAKFFDVVTYTGNGANRTIAHNLGSVPGCIMVKRIDGYGGDWVVYHRSLSNTQGLYLNQTAAAVTDSTFWNSTTPTSTNFSLGTNINVNATDGLGGTYVAYLFAHDAGGFGAAGTDNVISCGSFTADGSGNATVNLGYEPQWVLIKSSSGANHWAIIDNMRGFPADGFCRFLFPNLANTEASGGSINLNSTGFYSNATLSASQSYIYMAIRRGPMRTPTSGTSVFSVEAWTGSNTDSVVRFNNTFSSDAVLSRNRTNNIGANTGANPPTYMTAKLASASVGLSTMFTNAETDFQGTFTFLNKSLVFPNANPPFNLNGDTFVGYSFGRAPGFFDVVCYTGDGASNRNVTHSLGVTPSFYIVKRRSTTGSWWTWQAAFNGGVGYGEFNSSGQFGTGTILWGTGSPTSTTFPVSYSEVNSTGGTFVAYLFADCPGVSKAGIYVGTGAAQTINCGFTGGARFVLIKRTTGSPYDWYVWDTARGISAGNDPYLLMNSTAPETTGTDYISVQSSGFGLTATAPVALNASGVNYFFLAIA